MYRALIRITKENEIIDEYYFSDDDKGTLLLNATSWFLGYVKGVADFTTFQLQMPCVMSIDGYHVWGRKVDFKIELLNENDEIIKDIESII